MPPIVDEPAVRGPAGDQRDKQFPSCRRTLWPWKSHSSGGGSLLPQWSQARPPPSAGSATSATSETLPPVVLILLGFSQLPRSATGAFRSATSATISATFPPSCATPATFSPCKSRVVSHVAL